MFIPHPFAHNSSMMHDVWFIESNYHYHFRTNQLFVNCIAYFVAGGIVGIIFHKSHIFVPPLHISYSESCPDLQKNLCTAPLENEIGVLAFYMCLSLGVVTGAIGVRTFGGRRKVIFWREASSGINTFSYVIAEMLVDFFLTTIYCMFFASAIQLCIPLRASFGLWWVAFSVMSFTMMGMPYVLGYLVPDLETATTTAVLLGIVVVIFEGLLPEIGKNGVWNYAWWSGLALETIELTEGHNVNTTVNSWCEGSGFDRTEWCWQDADDKYISYFHFLVPEAHQILEPDLGRDLGIIVAIGIGIRIVAYFVIRFGYGEKKL